MARIVSPASIRALLATLTWRWVQHRLTAGLMSPFSLMRDGNAAWSVLVLPTRRRDVWQVWESVSEAELAFLVAASLVVVSESVAGDPEKFTVHAVRVTPVGVRAWFGRHLVVAL